jgi:AraC family transcriptional regulator, arabinose operon regulatory protein
MDLDILTRITARRGQLVRPADAEIAGLRLHALGTNRIDAPGRQGLYRPDPEETHLTWIVHGESMVREPGPARVAQAGDALLLPAGQPHRYASTDSRGWRAFWVRFDCPDLERLGLRAGILHPSPAAGRACADLAALAVTPGTSGPRLAAALAVLLAELATSPRPRRIDGIADTIAQQLRRDPLRDWRLAALAAEHGISWSSLRQAIRRRTGLSPDRLLRSARLDRAAQVLADGASVGEAAQAAGFADPFHFSRLFRRAYGVAPRDWRENAG